MKVMNTRYLCDIQYWLSIFSSILQPPLPTADWSTAAEQHYGKGCVVITNTVTISFILGYLTRYTHHLFYTPPHVPAVSTQSSLLILILLQPALILIDHGHFQYNCASLGLTFWAIIAIMMNYDITGSILFSLALNYKQMELYHATPFFCYLLGKALSNYPNGKWLRRVVYLGLAVIGTFVVCWSPFLGSWALTRQVLQRLFPFNRGLYEDKVANIWCSLSVLVKLKQLLSLPTLVKLTMVSTLTALIPSSWNLLRNPTPHRFILALVSDDNSLIVWFIWTIIFCS